MHPVDKKPKPAPAPAVEQEEEEDFPESEQATLIGLTAEELAASTARGLNPPAEPAAEAEPEEPEEPIDSAATMLGVSLQPAPEPAPKPPPKRPSVRIPKPTVPPPEVDPHATAPSAAPFQREPTDVESIEANATMMLDSAPAIARHEPTDVESIEANATMMLDSAPSLAKHEPTDVESLDGHATMMLDQAPVLEKPKPKVNEPGAYSRQLAREEKERKVVEGEVDPSATGQFAAASQPKGRLLVPIGALALVAVVVVVLGFVKRERVAVEQLQMLYPYGFGGAHGPHGEVAPGATDVTYTYVESVDCPSYVECMRYKYEGGSFSGTMVIGKSADGMWSRANEDGLPFPPPPPPR